MSQPAAAPKKISHDFSAARGVDATAPPAALSPPKPAGGGKSGGKPKRGGKRASQPPQPPQPPQHANHTAAQSQYQPQPQYQPEAQQQPPPRGGGGGKPSRPKQSGPKQSAPYAPPPGGEARAMAYRASAEAGSLGLDGLAQANTALLPYLLTYLLPCAAARSLLVATCHSPLATRYLLLAPCYSLVTPSLLAPLRQANTALEAQLRQLQRQLQKARAQGDALDAQTRPRGEQRGGAKARPSRPCSGASTDPAERQHVEARQLANAQKMLAYYTRESEMLHKKMARVRSVDHLSVLEATVAAKQTALEEARRRGRELAREAKEQDRRLDNCVRGVEDPSKELASLGEDVRVARKHVARLAEDNARDARELKKGSALAADVEAEVTAAPQPLIVIALHPIIAPTHPLIVLVSPSHTPYLMTLQVAAAQSSVDAGAGARAVAAERAARAATERAGQAAALQQQAAEETAGASAEHAEHRQQLARTQQQVTNARTRARAHTQIHI